MGATSSTGMCRRGSPGSTASRGFRPHSCAGRSPKTSVDYWGKPRTHRDKWERPALRHVPSKTALAGLCARQRLVEDVVADLDGALEAARPRGVHIDSVERCRATRDVAEDHVSAEDLGGEQARALPFRRD